MKKKYWLILGIFVLIIPPSVYLIKNRIDDYKFKQSLKAWEAETKKASLEKRKSFAKEWEQDIAKRRGPEWITLINAYGDDYEKLKFQAPWANRGMAYNTMKNREFILLLKTYGFKELVFTDGSDINTWNFDLTEQ